MRIGFIGLGIMGEPMCYNVIKKHDDKVYAFDIDAKKTALLAGYGAIACGLLQLFRAQNIHCLFTGKLSR